MTTNDNLRQDLAFVASAVRRHERAAGVPSIYFLWAVIVAVGFALPDFAPHLSTDGVSFTGAPRNAVYQAALARRGGD